MALVACPECRGSVSTSATSCPHCGMPLGNPAGAPALGAGLPARPATEQVLWEGGPSLKMLAADAIKTGVFAIVIVVGISIAYAPGLRFFAGLSKSAAELVAANTSVFKVTAILFTVAVVGLRIAKLVWRGINLRTHHYRVSNQRLTVETGVVAKTLVELDMRTIDDITFTQGIAERLLGIGRIDIVSSDPRAGVGQKARLSLIGILDPRAVRETIRTAAYEATRSQLFTRST